MNFYRNFFSKLNHTLKFVLFLPVRTKCCFYYQQLNVPQFIAIVTWIFVFFWVFFIIIDAMISDFFPQKLNKILKCGTKWEERELYKLENRRFHQKQHTFRYLKSFCRYKNSMTSNYCCCEQSPAPVHVSALSWPLLKRGRESTLKRIFRMNIKRKLHKNSCLQPISESSRFPFCCSHTWEKPWCRAFPYTPLNHSGWHKVKAFRLEFSDFASYFLSSVRPLNGCYSLVANNTICLAMAEQHFGLCSIVSSNVVRSTHESSF